MISTEEQRKELEVLSRPLIKWMNDNCHPHTEIRIDHLSAELLEGVCAIRVTDYIKD